jgi:hypothetical protein
MPLLPSTFAQQVGIDYRDSVGRGTLRMLSQRLRRWVEFAWEVSVNKLVGWATCLTKLPLDLFEWLKGGLKLASEWVGKRLSGCLV